MSHTRQAPLRLCPYTDYYSVECAIFPQAIILLLFMPAILFVHSARYWRVIHVVIYNQHGNAAIVMSMELVITMGHGMISKYDDTAIS